MYTINTLHKELTMPYSVKITTTKPAGVPWYNESVRQQILEFIAVQPGYIDYDDFTHSTPPTTNVAITTFDTEENYNNYVTLLRQLPGYIARAAYNAEHGFIRVREVL
jgi:hypothetical protein